MLSSSYNESDEILKHMKRIRSSVLEIDEETLKQIDISNNLANINRTPMKDKIAEHKNAFYDAMNKKGHKSNIDIYFKYLTDSAYDLDSIICHNDKGKLKLPEGMEFRAFRCMLNFAKLNFFINPIRESFKYKDKNNKQVPILSVKDVVKIKSYIHNISYDDLTDKLLSNPYYAFPTVSYDHKKQTLTTDKIDKIFKSLGLEHDEKKYSVEIAICKMFAILNETSSSYLDANDEENKHIVDAILPKTVSEEQNKFIQDVISIEAYNKYGKLYINKIYETEKGIAKMLSSVINQDNLKHHLYVKECEHRTSDEILKKIMNNPITLLTGRAGTGKTTVMAEVVNQMYLNNMTIHVMAFTAKAAKRAETEIHKFIPEDTLRTIDLNKQYDRDNPLGDITIRQGRVTISTIDAALSYGPDKLKKETNFIVIDEAGMVGTDKFYRLMKKIMTNVKRGSGVRMLLTGDINQLPPIGYGQVFRSMIGSVINDKYRIELTEVRRARGTILKVSDMLVGDQSINQGDINTINKSENMKIVGSPAISHDAVSEEFKDEMSRIHNSLGIDYLSNMKVLAATNKMVDKLNEQLRHIFRYKLFGDTQIDAGDKDGKRIFMLGDRVMLTENYTDGNIKHYNGEEGIVIGIGKGDNNYDRSLVVAWLNDELLNLLKQGVKAIPLGYSGKSEFKIKVKKDEVDEVDELDDYYTKVISAEHLKVSYACTVHKSQGSEYDHVYVCIPNYYKGIERSVYKELFYTAITRAKKHCTIYTTNDMVMRISDMPKRSFHSLQNTLIDQYITYCHDVDDYIEEYHEWSEMKQYNADPSSKYLNSREIAVASSYLNTLGIDLSKYVWTDKNGSGKCNFVNIRLRNEHKSEGYNYRDDPSLYVYSNRIIVKVYGINDHTIARK